MIDEETRQRAKEYADSFAEATADDPKPPAPDLEPMEPVKEAASAPVEDEDAKLFSEAFNAPDAPVKPAAPANFKDAFAHARKSGLKVFEFNGKKFTTALKSEMKAKPDVVKVTKVVSAESQLPVANKDAEKAKPTIYGNTFVKDAVDSIKAKLNDDTQVGKAKFHANGRPNLTAR